MVEYRIEKAFHFRSAKGNYEAASSSSEITSKESADALFVSYPHLLDASNHQLAQRAIRRIMRRRDTVPTPLGVLAGVGSGAFGSKEADSSDQEHLDIRLDTTAVLAIYRSLLQAEEFLLGATFQWNEASVRQGESYVVARLGVENRAERAKVRITSLTVFIEQRTRSSVVGEELLEALHVRSPSRSRPEIFRYIRALLAANLLTSSWLTEAIAERTPSVIARLIVKSLPPDSAWLADNMDVVQNLRELEAPLLGYSGDVLDENKDFISATRTSLEKFGVDPKVSLQIDSYTEHKLYLPDLIRESIDDALNFAANLGDLEVAESRSLDDYIELFVETYGVGVHVPLLEAVDEYSGIGFPVTYAAPRSNFRTSGDGRGQAVDGGLADLLATLPRPRDGVLTLAKDLVNRTDELSQQSRSFHPTSFDACFRVLSSSPDDLENGKFRLVHEGQSRHAGMYSGRFARGLPGLSGRLADAAARLLPPSTHPVEIVPTPLSESAGNVLAGGRWLAKQLHIGGFSPPGSQRLRDIFVSADGRGLQFYDRNTSERLVFFLPSMINVHGFVPNMARFLVEMSHPVMPNRWRWGRFDRLPILPRVEVGRSVLSRKRWRIPSIVIWPSGSTSLVIGAREEERLRLWLEEYEVDPICTLDDPGKSGISIDITDGEALQTLLQVLRKRGEVVLTESDAAIVSRPFGWTLNRATEIVVNATEIVSNQTIQAAAELGANKMEGSGSVPAESTTWVSCNLYLAFDDQDALIRRYFDSDFSNIFSGLFFWIRYSDPEPHIRLRIATTDQHLSLLVKFAQELHGRNAIAKWMIGAFVPELTRYGGASCEGAMYEGFAADSAFARSALGRSADVIEGLVVSIARLLVRCDIDGESWILNNYHQAPIPPFLRRIVKSVVTGKSEVSLIPEEVKWYGLVQVHLEAVADSGDSVLKSILHMHFNRFIGINRSLEESAISAVRELLKQSRYSGNWGWI